jgi:MFS family permease
MCVEDSLNPSLVEKTNLEYAKEFWTLANVVTGFSVVQGFTFVTVAGPRSGTLFCAITKAIPDTRIGIIVSTTIYAIAILFCYFARNCLLKTHDALSLKLKIAFAVWLFGQLLAVALFAALSMAIVLRISPQDIKKCLETASTRQIVVGVPKDKSVQNVRIVVPGYL